MRFLALLSATLLAIALAPATVSAQEPGVSPAKLKLSTPGHESVVLSLAEFGALPHLTVTVKNGHSDAQEVYSGVRLTDLMTKVRAPLGKELRGKAMTCGVRASAADGYAVLFSISELDPEFHPGEIIVADQMNGQRLDERSGRFKLVASEAKRPARWVRNLTTLVLKAGAS